MARHEHGTKFEYKSRNFGAVRNIGPALLRPGCRLLAANTSAPGLELKRFTFKKWKKCLILSLKCSEWDDLEAGARFHLVKTSYINKMGLEIRDKIDLCERFELWPHSLPHLVDTLVIGK